MFRASLCPSSGEQNRVLQHMMFCTGCAGCGCVEPGRKLFALCAHSLRPGSLHPMNFELHSVLFSFTLLSAVSFTFVAHESSTKTKFYRHF